MQEIERKFLVIGKYKSLATKSTRIIQGYLNTAPERTVRVRIQDEKAYINIKGIGNDSGTSRYEWEKEITAAEAKELLKICEPGIIDKTRYFVPAGKHIFEIDEFHGENKGLTVAEIELASENEAFEKPAFLRQEVTGDVKYYNASLTKNPFRKWRHS